MEFNVDFYNQQLMFIECKELNIKGNVVLNPLSPSKELSLSDLELFNSDDVNEFVKKRLILWAEYDEPKVESYSVNYEDYKLKMLKVLKGEHASDLVEAVINANRVTLTDKSKKLKDELDAVNFILNRINE